MSGRRKKAFVLIEALLGLALFSIYVAAFFPVVIGVREVPFFAGNRDRAIFICEEGLEAVRNIRDADFANLSDGTYGLAISGNEWSFSGTFDNVGDFTRTIEIATVDANTKSVTCNVTWNQTDSRSATIELVTYLANWRATGFDGDCDWSEISVPPGGVYDYPGNDDGVKVMSQGNYAYVVIGAGGDTYDFAIQDISDPENVSLVGSLSLGTNITDELTNLFVRGDYAYVTSRNDSAELYIIDVADPSNPILASGFNVSGTADALGVYIVGETAYVSRAGNAATDELIIVDVGTAISPTVLGSADLGGVNEGGYELVVMNNYAFVASEETGAQLKVVDVTDSNNPNYLNTSFYSLSQSVNKDATSIYGFDNTITLGATDGYVYLIDVTDPTSIDQTNEISNYSAGDTVYDVSVAPYNGVENGAMFIVSALNVNEELHIVDITTPATPVDLSSYQFSDSGYGVYADKQSCALYVVTGSNTDPEFNILLAGDQVAPAAVVDLVASAPTLTTIDLDWTAPGDDANIGTATSYDIRYATTTITEINWAAATQVTGEPIPSIAGTLESMTVTGLSNATTYYFAIKTTDDVGNISDISNIATETTGSTDVTPPAAVADLVASSPTTTTIDLDWTAPGDDNNTGTATSYDIRYSTATITEANWAAATQVTGEPIPSIAGTPESMTVTGLNYGTTYYFAIKTSDEVPNESAISNVTSATTTTPPPIIIFDETFPNTDAAWNGSGDTAQDESVWGVRQGSGDPNDILISNSAVGLSPSGGTHLTFNDCDNGWGVPQLFDHTYISINLSGYQDVVIDYYWQSDDVDGSEGLLVEYSTNSTDGSNGTWTQIAIYNNPATDDVWTHEVFNLPNIDAVSTFMIRFSSKSNANNENMYVDDITFTGVMP